MFFFLIFNYSAAESWWKIGTRYNNKGAGTKIKKCLMGIRHPLWNCTRTISAVIIRLYIFNFTC